MVSHSEYNNKVWDNILKTEKEDANFSLNNYVENISNLVTKHAPLRKLNKKELKCLSKPWISLGLQTSIRVKNNLHSKFINSTDSFTKSELYEKYKIYRNKISTLLKQSKKNYYDNFFKTKY